MRVYSKLVRIILAKLLVLVAVLIMPFAMTPANASMSSHHQMASMPMGHCDEQAPSHAGKNGIAECTMACSAALPATAPPQEDLPPVAPAALHSAVPPILHGLHPDTATPPPKPA